MDDTVSGAQRTPWHVWAVGVISLLWNAFGAFDYVMSKLSPQSYFHQMGLSDASVAYMLAFPAWLTAFWALGVWGSVAGSVLLLMRSRHAVTAFVLSLLGLAVSQGYQALVMRPPENPGSAITVVIWASLALFLYYAWAMARRGVLR
ncbi:hypothetical protein [Novosphingobium sp.]|uniref:hypothetical protein n=1 Tax=Novosphingobium sp. TaxID=1874826 RepID=UPI0025ED128D|nr:hypothetical protein [Novosphingobium sp.]